MVQFETELKKLGLNDKEAAVYLACLQLGPSPAQQIARRAKVVRATTYVILASLMQRGLVTQYKQGKKTLFSSEPPQQLVRLLEKQIEEIQSKQHDLSRILPELQVLMKTAGGRPSVRYFEGIEGLRAIRQEIVMYTRPGDIVYNFTPTDHLNAIFPDDIEAQIYYHQRAAKGVHSKTLFTTGSEKIKQILLSKPYTRLAERRFISPAFFPSTSGMTIYHDRIAIGSFSGKLMGVVIESGPMADMMRRLFDLAWLGAEVLDKK